MKGSGKGRADEEVGRWEMREGRVGACVPIKRGYSKTRISTSCPEEKNRIVLALDAPCHAVLLQPRLGETRPSKRRLNLLKITAKLEPDVDTREIRSARQRGLKGGIERGEECEVVAIDVNVDFAKGGRKTSDDGNETTAKDLQLQLS